MRKSVILASAALFATLAACGGKGDDKLADRVEDAADNRANALDDQADALRQNAKNIEQRADNVRDLGEERGDAIDAADVNADNMSAAQKNAIVAGDAPAVR